jgi:two-component system sensor histidine kinase/response regulator
MNGSTVEQLLRVHHQLAEAETGGAERPRSLLAAILESDGMDGIWTLLQMMEQSPVSIVLTNPSGEIEYVNERFVELTGYSASEVIGQNCRILQSGLTPRETYREMWAAIQTGIWHGEFANRKKNGDLYWESARIGPLRDRGGAVAHYLAVKEDITCRKCSEAERERSEQRLNLASSIASDAIYELDAATLEVTLFTPARVGRNRERIPSNASEWFKLMHPDDVVRVRAAFDRSLASGRPFSQEYRTLRAGGRARYWRNRAVPVRSAMGTVTKWVGVVIDITQQRTAEQQLAELAQRLQNKNEELVAALDRAKAATEMKSRFLANMSHEIRTPLNGIIGTAEMLLHLQPTGEQREYIDIIRDCGLSLLTVLNDILDISKLEAGKVKVQRVRYEPRHVVADVVNLMRTLAESKGLYLSDSVDEPVPRHALGDPVRITQVLNNLVSNAIKFTSTGGVQIRVAARGPADATGLEYTVTDTGAGIPEDKQSTIFESFVQGDESLARKHGGTGLGLAISRQLARLMGGDIRLASRSGEGSTFTLSLPLVRVPEEPAPTPALPLEPQSQRRSAQCSSILLVEDNPVNQRIVQQLLLKSGYSVAVAGNGHQALDMLSAARYDLVLMDVQMPEMDGVEAARRIRAAGNHVHIIALTANAMPGDRELYLSAGMNDYLAKPFSFADLMAKLAQYSAGGSA